MGLYLVLPLLLISLGTTFLFHYEACNSKLQLSPPHGMFPFVRSVLYSFSGIVFFLFSAPLHFILRRKVRFAGSTAPIILFHGAQQHTGVWWVMRHWLKACGFQRVYCHAYSSGGRSMDDLVCEVDRALAVCAKLYPDTCPFLVGHSMGGLLLRLWLCAQQEPSNQVAGIVTLGCPHRGSKTAKLFGTLKHNLHEDMAYCSAFFAQVEAKESPASIPCVALYSRTDNIIHPENAMIPPPSAGWKVSTTPPVSHMWLLLHPAICRMVVEELRGCLQSSEE